MKYDVVHESNNDFLLASFNRNGYTYMKRDMIDWLSENTNGDIVMLESGSSELCIRFKLEEDAVAFKLRWV